MLSRITAYREDNTTLARRYPLPFSEEHRTSRRQNLEEHEAALLELDYESLSPDDRVDWHLLRNLMRLDRTHLAQEEAREDSIALLLPFARSIVALSEARMRFEDVEGKASAATVAAIETDVRRTMERLEAGAFDGIGLVDARRAASAIGTLRNLLKNWFRFFDGYDPEFSWWVVSPHRTADLALAAYEGAVRRRLVDPRSEGDSSLIGDPIGVEALNEELRAAMIPYTPAELIALARRELAWCDQEMEKAAKELGFTDWRAAQDAVKERHVAPGKQPAMIRDLAHEAIRFLEARDLLTIPELCKNSWRMAMMTPERQRVNPYFLGGETIIVSYPTDTMTHEEKLMSMRGNNEHFARATVHHELIPGHHLQHFMTARHRPERSLFDTPFWIEGWALYWELRMWELGLHQTPQDRIGMLFWRKHRCARIIFSLGFHSGEMTPRACVDFLVERVGHERRNAEAEVRRSVGPDYSPLYQAAYLLGGLQLRALQRELVVEGKMSEKDFHDRVLRENSIPIELLRSVLRGDVIPRDFTTSWRFYEHAASDVLDR